MLLLLSFAFVLAGDLLAPRQPVCPDTRQWVGYSLDVADRRSCGFPRVMAYLVMRNPKRPNPLGYIRTPFIIVTAVTTMQ